MIDNSKLTDIFDQNDEKLNSYLDLAKEIQPLVETYLSKSEKKEHFEQACILLGVSKRTLYRYIKAYKEDGLLGLMKKIRKDKGCNKKFKPIILTKALDLLEENPYRSVEKVKQLLAYDNEVQELVKKISVPTLYHHLKKSGYDFKHPFEDKPGKLFHRFEAQYASQLWQSDARNGIPLPDPVNPKKLKMTYCYVIIDDFSRKILYACYFWDEKLPRLEFAFRQAMLRFGLCEKAYVDNGSTYVSKHFAFLISSLKVKLIHHRAYQAWCKGNGKLRIM